MCETGAGIGAADVLAPFATGQLWRLLLRSLALAATVTALALAIGVPLGIIFARAQLPFQRLLFGAHVSILFLPASARRRGRTRRTTLAPKRPTP
jgi:ABC-type glycerol-3-phosphate transport system permease component